ncbi:NfeD family protein [bacterium]|nr:NfeD family protein [bacterium]
MTAWQLWAIGGLVLLIGEVFTPGFVLACFALGCGAAALLAALKAGAAVQTIAFAAVSFASLFLIRPLFSRVFPEGKAVKTNTDALIGKTGIVSQAPLDALGTWRAMVDGEDWSVVSLAESELAEGQKVKVIKVDGSRLIVETY